MTVDEQIKKQFEKLLVEGSHLRHCVLWQDIGGWATSALHLLGISFGTGSDYYRQFSQMIPMFMTGATRIGGLRNIISSAKDDYEAGLGVNLQVRLSGELLGDFVALAKQALSDGHKDVAAVLASAALEDALKRFARLNGLDTDGKSMQDIVGALKAKGLVGGAQKTLFETMPKIRDYAMHAEWGKLDPASVNSLIGFVEQFLLSKFS